MKNCFLLLFFILAFSVNVFSQCCSGGSGSPIAGGVSQGVLAVNQVDISSSFQLANTNTFYSKDSRDTAVYFDSFNSKYLYSRMAYGVTKDFTLSLETGYFINKTQVGLHKIDTITSSGIGDLVIFPRYDILNRMGERGLTEITLGLGYKVPLGKYNDSIKQVEPFSGNVYYLAKPLGVQVSSGAQDFIFYAFFFQGFSEHNFRIFSNAIYIKKGWNPLGEKIGDYASIGLFASKTLFGKLGLTLQLKGEWIDKMSLNKNIRLYAYPNYDPDATGSKKVFVLPQVSYIFRNHFTVFGLWEMPVYQYVTKTQVGSELLFTTGFSYRFKVKK